MADLVTKLGRLGATVIVFDVLFAEPDRTNPDALARTVPGLDDAVRAKLRSLGSNDTVLANAIKENRVVLGQAGHWEKQEKAANPPVNKLIAFQGPKPSRWVQEVPSMILNIPQLREAAAGHGHFSLFARADGVVRAIPTLLFHNGGFYPSLTIETLRVAFDRRTILVTTNKAGIDTVFIASRKQFPPRGLAIPTDADGMAWVYFSRSDEAKYVSALDVLAGSVDEALIRDKIVMIGSSASGLSDIKFTPSGQLMPGVEVHAQFIESVMTGRGLIRPSFARGTEFLFILVAALITIVLVPMVAAVWTLPLFIVIEVVIVAISWTLFTRKLVLLDPSFAMLMIAIIYLVLSIGGQIRSEIALRRAREP